MSSNGQNNLPEALLNMNNQLQMIMQLGSLLNQGALGGLNLGGSPQLGSPPQIPQQTLQQQQLQQPLAPPQNTPNLFSILGLPQNATASAGSANGITNGMGGMVGSCENDEELLVSALRESGAKGWTYRQALESLHGVRSTPMSENRSAIECVVIGTPSYRESMERLLPRPCTAY